MQEAAPDVVPDAQHSVTPDAVQKAARDAAPDKAQAMLRVAVPADARPLTEAQDGLWYAQALDPANPILNTGQYLDLTGPLDLPALREALARTLAEAEALRLRFAPSPQGPVQWLAPAPPVLSEVDLSGYPAPEAEAMALAQMRADSGRPLDLAADACAAFTLFVIRPDRCLVYERIHHLAIDGYGMVLVTDRIAAHYRALTTGAPAPAPFPPLARAHDEDAAWRANPRRAADGDWWRARLETLPDEIASPSASAARPVSGPAFLRETAHLALPGLPARAEALGIGWPDLLTALVGAYLARWTTAGTAVIGVPFMARMGRRIARLPCMAMNVLPHILCPDEDAPLDDWLRAAAARLAEDRRHGLYRSEQLRRDLGRVGGNRRLYGPLVNVQPFDRAPDFGPLACRLHILGAGAVDDLTLTFRGDPEALIFEVDANPALYAPEDVAGHATRLPAFITAALAASRLAEVPTAAPAEIAAIAALHAAARQPLPDTTLTALVEAQIAATPAAPAVIFGDTVLTYADLDRRSAALAAALVARGAGPGRIVAVALDRSAELPLALLAVLRAGAAWLPLDPEHPPERIAGILAQAQPVVVLTEVAHAGLFPPGAPLLEVADWAVDGVADDLAHGLADCAPGGDFRGASAPHAGTCTGAAAPADHAFAPAPGLDDRLVASPDDPAYVIFTSGSTGAPKGVVVGHRAIANRLLWMADAYAITPADRILQKTPATFDVSVWEFFLPLIRGARLVMAPPGAHRDPVRLAAEVRRHAITAMHFVPSMLSAFLAAPASEGLAVARVFCSGEELTADHRDRFHRRVTGALHNLYGPTEAAVDVSYWEAERLERSKPVPIGWPVWNTRLEVLDERLRPVPSGLAGHLYLGGVQLAHGYLGRPDLTAERFISDPANPGQRLYATGDLARRRHDGAVVYLGRSDHQVKLRGLRIELGEIEAAIMASGLAAEAVVLAREDRAGDKRLVAYLVPTAGWRPGLLAQRLGAVLPAYMIPAAEVTLPALPVTLNGKLDRKALPAPVLEAAVGRAAASPTEALLAGLYAEVLGLPQPAGAEADFFALGGDSLSAVRLVLRIEEETGRDPGLGAVFEQPVLTALAAVLDAADAAGPGAAPAADDGLGPALLLADGDADALPLVLIHPAGGLSWGYRHLARLIAPARRVWGLQHPGLAPGAAMPPSLEALAEDYAARIAALADGGGPVHLAGWSVGGIIAQEIAALRAAAGLPGGMVAMLDSYPADAWRDEPEPDEAAALRALLAVAGHDPEVHRDLDSRAAVVGFLRDSGSALGALPTAVLDGVVRTVTDTGRLVRAHEHRRCPGRLIHIGAGRDHSGTALSPAMWQPYGAEIEALSVPFLHAEMTSPAASALIAPLLAARMEG